MRFWNWSRQYTHTYATGRNTKGKCFIDIKHPIKNFHAVIDYFYKILFKAQENPLKKVGNECGGGDIVSILN